MTDLLARYDEQKPNFDSFALSLKSLLTTFIRNAEITVHSLESRVKTRKSLEQKIIKKDKYEDLNQVTDIIGIRIITHYSEDVDKIASIVEKEFSIDKDNSIDKRATMEPDRFGYLSLHYIISLNDNRTVLNEYSPYKNIKAEIQIRSILQHAWAEIEHDIGYKSSVGLPNDIRRYFSRLAGLLELADDEFVKIRKGITARQKEVVDTLESGTGEITLDVVSLLEYIDHSKAITKIAHSLNAKHGISIGKYVKDKSGMDLDYILNLLDMLDIKSTGKLEALLMENHDKVVKRVAVFTEGFMEYYRRNQIPRSTIIIYLCQVIVALKNDPVIEAGYNECLKSPDRKDTSSSFFEEIRMAIQEN